ncbi:IDEAL domain-containing protein [Peribacillus glennii]|uniref:IDEAL domain-containing protein n=1 Tax=Peribacillus glennii TaxID=2303991 RepID=A0A372L625_9BACI|nr:IDEAL domain-containing protein [Peribacillus glennii]RFU60440.1 IDEAL domain-containing protein [Peribacillus glennii]
MNPEYKSGNYRKDQYIKSTSELFDKEDLKTKKILAKEHTEYTAGANRVIQKVQKQYLENKRYMEIDKALDERDKARFLALTSKGWERVL